MRQTWRWFGPKDIVAIDDMLQAGVEGVVSALHHVPNGTVWSPEEIAKRQREIGTRRDGTPSGLIWEVVESVPPSEDIKKQSGDWKAHIEAYRQTLRNLADAGIEVVCYNFMPVLDWTRTDIAWRVGHGGTCMRFDLLEFAVFDIHILQRPGARDDFPPELVAAADRRFAEMDEAAKTKLGTNVGFGLPGANDRRTLDEVRALVGEYQAMPAETLRAHLVDFLGEVVPTAEEVGIRLCCHPDDPPFPLLGLPRVMSTAADYAAVLDAVDSPANGVTFCTGSFGARPDNELPAMFRRFADRVHFVHLRNVKRQSPDIRGSFYEAEHLGGDTDMVAVIAEIVAEERRRKAAGRADVSIPFRPDHGQDILDDLNKKGQPGYPAIGRLKGLAELRGIMTTLTHPAYGMPA
jgi:mannonate dehydratase